MGFMMAGCVLVGAADLGAIGAGVCGEGKNETRLPYSLVQLSNSSETSSMHSLHTLIVTSLSTSSHACLMFILFSNTSTRGSAELVFSIHRCSSSVQSVSLALTNTVKVEKVVTMFLQETVLGQKLFSLVMLCLLFCPIIMFLTLGHRTASSPMTYQITQM